MSIDNQRFFFYWASSRPLLSLNKKENTKYKNVATAIATPNASTYQLLKINTKEIFYIKSLITLSGCYCCDLKYSSRPSWLVGYRDL